MAFKYPPEQWERLLRPDRESWQSPEAFLEIAQPKPNEIWADLGCGPGYFTIPLAERVAKVYAIDSEEEMLQACARRSASFGNITFSQCTEEVIPLPPSAVSKVLMANLLHELLQPEKFLSEVKRTLRAEGELFLLDWHPTASPLGPPLESRLSKERALKKLSPLFELTGDFPIYPYHYLLSLNPRTRTL